MTENELDEKQREVAARAASFLQNYMQTIFSIRKDLDLMQQDMKAFNDALILLEKKVSRLEAQDALDHRYESEEDFNG